MATSTNARYGVYSHEFAKFVSDADLSFMEEMDNLPVSEGRAMMSMMEKSPAAQAAFAGVTHTDHRLHDRPVTARVFQPANTKKDGKLRPLVLFYHGGAFMYGGPSTEGSTICQLVRNHDLIVVSIDYRLTPEVHFPIPTDDCWAGFQWALSHAEELGAAPNRVFVAGSSAGANLAAAMALKARDAGMTGKQGPLRGQILCIPCTCHWRHHALARQRLGVEMDSYEQVGEVPMLGARKMARMWDAYYTPEQVANEGVTSQGRVDAEVETQAEALVSPLLARDLSGLPPAYIQVAGADVLRDEGIAFAEALKNAGVEVKLDIYSGVGHMFRMEALGFEAGKKAMRDLDNKVTWLLSTC